MSVMDFTDSTYVDVVIARNRGHLNPETSLTSMPLITPFDPRNFLFWI